ncbi:hypothetical protein BYT27DRAFT_7198123 [Phlegmacium glaucopus]|nr:hypothetical protein BYT27DRAFT_7198123 [Phlegmacium glaucopus]
MGLSTLEATFLGTVLEGFFYGVYCIVFSLYLSVQKRTGRNLLNYPIAALFILCTAFFPLDFTQQFLTIFRGGAQQIVPWNINLATSTIYSLVDFISQSVLIYRCWVMWGRQALVIVLPSMLALTSLATSLSLVAELSVLRSDPHNIPPWFLPMGVASFSLSLTVNTIVTGLLVLKLVLLHREVTRALPTSSIHRGGQGLFPLISILIESGMFTFIGQLVWVVMFRLQNTGFNSVGSPITMIYGITPTIIIVRVAMGTSYDNRTKPESTIRFTINEHRVGATTTLGSCEETTGHTRMQKSTNDFQLEKIEGGIYVK